MTRAAARSKPADAYNHGDLREALETTPPEAITLKALATQLGVSQPAPYRHFASREALLKAIAEDGFRRFLAALQASEPGPPEAVMDRSLAAYLAFARANRGVYRLMFASNILHTAEADGSLAQAAHAAFHRLLSSVQAHARPERAQAVAVWIWASLHGIAMLEAEGLLTGAAEAPMPPDEVLAELADAVRARL